MTANREVIREITKTPRIFFEMFFQIFAGNTRKAHRSITQKIFTEKAINKLRNKR